MGLPRPAEPPHAVHTFLKYPVFVRERDRFIRAAAARGIALSDWFRSPIHPVTSEWETWLYEAGSNPVAEERSRRCVNLPTQPGVRPDTPRESWRFSRGTEKRSWSNEFQASAVAESGTLALYAPPRSRPERRSRSD